jgi:hypothetical protein
VDARYTKAALRSVNCCVRLGDFAGARKALAAAAAAAGPFSLDRSAIAAKSDELEALAARLGEVGLGFRV